MEAGLIIIAAALALPRPDLIVSANDGKFVRQDGAATYPRPAPPDSLTVIDARPFPPVVRDIITGVEHTLAGPPQAVAITPDQSLAVVGAPSRYDDAQGKEVLDAFLQIVDLNGTPPRVTERVALGSHPNGLVINRQGDLLLVACLDGSVKVLTIRGHRVALAGSVKVSAGRLSSVAFTIDGRHALVSLRDEGGVAVLAVDGPTVTLTDERVSTGLAPYAIDVSPDGRWAAVGDVGLGGFSGHGSPGDSDLVTLIDVSKRPFRAVQHLTTPAIPEGVAISPDSRWLVVQAMNGSNLPAKAPLHHAQGRLVLFALSPEGARKVSEAPVGVAAQGVVFAADSRTILVQLNVERQIAVYRIQRRRLTDTGVRLPLAAGPASIRAAPR